MIKSSSPRNGSTLVLLIVLLPVVLAVCAYVINVVYMELARTELQVSTDVATRAAGRVLAVTGSEAQSREAADRMLRLNGYASQQLTARDTNISFGVSTRLEESERYSFEPGKNPNAVNVEVGGRVQVPMLFPTMGVPVDFRPIKSAISTQSELDIAIVLDRSGSMAFGAGETAGEYLPAAAPFGWKYGLKAPAKSRWTEAVNSVSSFIDYLNSTSHNEHLALVTYSDKATIDSKLVGNYTQIKTSMMKHSLKFEGGATNIGDGITFGAAALSDAATARSWASRILIVLTDGNWTTGQDPIIAATNAAGQNIIIYTITFSDEANQECMSKIAAIGKGQHLHASSGLELTAAFREIARSLPTLLTY